MKLAGKRYSHTFYGGALWLVGIQYYLVQIVAALYWQGPDGYSLSANTISDLGNTGCGPYGASSVCSPLHPLMNVSFVLLGLSMLCGALLLKQQYGKRSGSALGFWCIAAAGVGTILVGLFPENTVPVLHSIGAALPFLLGNVGLVVLGSTLKDVPPILRVSALLSGLVASAALVLFVSHAYPGIGIGGMERIVAYPQTTWMILFGAYLVLREHSIATPAQG